jgi:hypothetical protein
MTAGIQGLQSSRLTAAPDDGDVVAIEAGAVYNYNHATVTLGGAATALVSSFELGIENNVTTQQTDDSIPYDVVEGLRAVSHGFDLIYESLAEYNTFHYGGAAGTANDPDIFTTSALFSFDLGAANSIAFNLPSIAYEEFPVESDPGGDPITVAVRAVGQRSGSPIVTATVKNQVASYGAAYALPLKRTNNTANSFRDLPADRGIPGFGVGVDRLVAGVRSLGLGGRYIGGHPANASLTTALAGTNNDLTYRAVKYGPNGNNIRVRYVVSGASTPLSVDVDGNDITVNVETDGSSAAVSTAEEVAAAVNADTDAGRLVRAENADGNDGTGVVAALAYTALSGGSYSKQYADAPSEA